MEASSNGHTNGHANGSLKAKAMNGMNGHSVAPRRRTPLAKARPGFFARTFSMAARLAVWYSILTLLFRCPASLDACDETTPKICRPYFQAKQAIAPHWTPYYDAYAAPYVDLARPYYDKVDQVVITPSRTFAIKHGGPRLAKAQEISLAQWERNLQPQLLKYQAQAKTHYDQSIAPHVEKASAAVTPYYSKARVQALQKYHDIVLPSYLVIQPYAAQGYQAASKFTAEKAVPSTVWAWNKTYLFLDSTVWPRLRDVYVVTVEPQLVRIGERLGRYKEKSSNSAATDEADSQPAKSTFAKPSASVSSSTASTAATGTPQPETTVSSTEDAAPTPDPDDAASQETEQPTREQIREIAAQTVAEDLATWQGKFAQAAEDSAIEIEERIGDISKDIIENQVNNRGKSLVAQLDETAKHEIATLKQTILSIVEKKQNGNKEMLEEELASAVRAAGINIKSRAQDIRTWRQTYEDELEGAVTKVADEHLQILEAIRDLAIQKIGMKWAWMEGITYKDWQKYHQLRDKLEEWTEDIKRLVVTHPGVEQAQKACSEVEDAGMSIASEAAQELSNLKQVALLKALAGDLSDDFDVSTMKLAAETAEKKAAEAAEAFKQEAETAEEDVHSMADKLEDTAGSAVPPVDTLTVSLEEVKEDTESSATPALESTASTVKDHEPDLASDNVLPHLPDITDNATSVAGPPQAPPSSGSVEVPEQIEETIVASPEDATPPAEASTTASVKSAMFGAAAQSVPSQQPILDDDTEDSLSSAMSAVRTDVPHSITSAAQAAYTAAIAEAADKYSRAMSAVSVQISGKPKPAHEEMLSSVSNAYFSAMASANSGLGAALTAASEGIYGSTPTGWAAVMPTVPSVPSVDWEKIQSIAQQNLQNGVNWAGDQYESAKVVIGAAEPTPSTPSDKFYRALDQAKHNYYAGLGVAHARYEEFLSAASSAASSITATPTPTDFQGSASSAAAAASSAAASAASVVGDSVTGAGEALEENWDFLVSKVSSQVYGAPVPTPWYENVYAAVGEYAAQATDAASSYASEAGDYATAAGDYAADNLSAATSVAGDYAGSATSMAGDYAGSATSMGASEYSAVSSLLSELVYGKEPTFTESVMSRLAGAYGLATATVASAVSGATETVASAATQVKETAAHIVDEL